jgi:hypothetical protein
LQRELICLWVRCELMAPCTPHAATVIWTVSQECGRKSCGLVGKEWAVVLLLKPPDSMLVLADLSPPRLPHAKVGFIFREGIISH